MKKYILIICIILLILYTINKILDNKGIQLANNAVYIFLYIFDNNNNDITHKIKKNINCNFFNLVSNI